MAHPSPWRASGVAFGIAAVGGLLMGGWLSLTEPAAGAFVAVFTVALIGGLEFQAAYRLNVALREFAGQVPGEPEADVSVWGDQTLRWDDLPLEVSGSTHRYRVQDLEVEAGDRSWFVPPIRAREGARRALDALGREVAADRWEDRLPTSYPRLAGAKLAVTVAIGGPLLYLIGAYALDETIHPVSIAAPFHRTAIVAILVVALVAGVARWTTLRRIRRALTEFREGLREQGVRVARIDLLGGLVVAEYRVYTADGEVGLRCLAHPWGRLRATVGGREQAAPFPEARTVGRAVAAELHGEGGAQREADGSTDGHVPVPSRERLSFGVFGAGIVAMGLWLLVDPPSAGECSSGCGGLGLVESVPFGVEILGAIVIFAGFASLWIALRGSVPRDAARWTRE